MATCSALNHLSKSVIKAESSSYNECVAQLLNENVIHRSGEQKFKKWLINKTQDTHLVSVIAEFNKGVFSSEESLRTFCIFANGHVKDGCRIVEIPRFLIDEVTYKVFFTEEDNYPKLVFYQLAQKPTQFRSSPQTDPIEAIDSSDDCISSDVYTADEFSSMYGLPLPIRLKATPPNADESTLAMLNSTRRKSIKKIEPLSQRDSDKLIEEIITVLGELSISRKEKEDLIKGIKAQGGIDDLQSTLILDLLGE